MTMKHIIPGFVQWFPFEEYDLLDRSIRAMQKLRITDLRTCFSWADWERPGGQEWLDWVVKQLSGAGIRLFPSPFYTPMRCAILPEGACREDALTAYPPENPKEYVHYIEQILDRYGDTFDCLLPWNEPNNTAYWRKDLDPGGKLFNELMLGALHVLHDAKKKVAIGSLIPPYGPWMQEMREAGILEQADAIGIHDFPGTWNDNKRVWLGWEKTLENVRELAYPHHEIWITETGYSTRTLEHPEDPEVQQRREEEQAMYLAELCNLQEADRIFWYSIFDQPPGHLTDNELNRLEKPPHDPRADGLGIITHDGRPKRLFQVWHDIVHGVAV